MSVEVGVELTQVDVVSPTEIALTIAENTTVLELEDTSTVVEVAVAPVEVVEVVVVGPQGATGASGAPGSAGPVGPSGPAGGASGSYTFVQNSVTNVWVITHGLGYVPAVTVFDSGNTQQEGSVVPTDLNTVTITFSAAFSGIAYLS